MIIYVVLASAQTDMVRIGHLDFISCDFIIRAVRRLQEAGF